jgi:hypothetical protein
MALMRGLATGLVATLKAFKGQVAQCRQAVSSGSASGPAGGTTSMDMKKPSPGMRVVSVIGGLLGGLARQDLNPDGLCMSYEKSVAGFKR